MARFPKNIDEKLLALFSKNDDKNIVNISEKC
jgi:hypothetical protein